MAALKLRHQLAAYSPVGVVSIGSAVLAAAGRRNSAPGRLRERLLTRYAADDCVLCGSGTQALQYALEMVLPASRRDAFIALPAFNCYDMASAALGAGVRVALYDVDPLTLAPDLASFERVVAAGAAAAVLACLYGAPFDWGAHAAIAQRYGVPLVEDAAQGHGASWQGVPVGGLAGVSIVSFGRGKGWTGGNGGAVLVRGQRATRTLMAPGASANARTAVVLAAQWMLGRPALYGLPRSMPSLALGETEYHPPAKLTSMTTAAASAAIENESASRVEAGHRAASAERYIDGLAGSGITCVRVPAGARPGYIRFPALVPGGLRSLPPRAAELGVAASYPTTLAALPELQASLVAVESTHAGADRLAADLVTLPAHSRLRPAEQAEIIEMLRRT